MEVNLQLQLVALDASVHKSQILRDNLIENEASNGRLYNTGLLRSVRHLSCHSHLNLGVERYLLVLVGQDCLVHALERHALALHARSLLGQVVDTKDHILGRNGHRASVGRL